jgi:hypothetical protein
VNQIRNPKSDPLRRRDSAAEMQKPKMLKPRRPIVFWTFPALNFGFVSDFGLRISDLRLTRPLAHSITPIPHPGHA